MPVQRGYRQVCGVARALDVVGERWALLVVRELLLGPKRFTDLQAGMPGASPNALSDRLRELADNPDATLTTSTTALLTAFDQHQPADDGDTHLDGDRDAVRRLLAGVTVPSPAR
jgi:hypothetical protein